MKISMNLICIKTQMNNAQYSVQNKSQTSNQESIDNTQSDQTKQCTDKQQQQSFVEKHKYTLIGVGGTVGLGLCAFGLWKWLYGEDTTQPNTKLTLSQDIQLDKTLVIIDCDYKHSITINNITYTVNQQYGNMYRGNIYKLISIKQNHNFTSIQDLYDQLNQSFIYAIQNEQFDNQDNLINWHNWSPKINKIRTPIYQKSLKNGDTLKKALEQAIQELQEKQSITEDIQLFKLDDQSQYITIDNILYKITGIYGILYNNELYFFQIENQNHFPSIAIFEINMRLSLNHCIKQFSASKNARDYTYSWFTWYKCPISSQEDDIKTFLAKYNQSLENGDTLKKALEQAMQKEKANTLESSSNSKE